MINVELFLSASLRLCVTFCFVACNFNETKTEPQKINIEKDNSILYAKRFSIAKTNGFKTLYLFFALYSCALAIKSFLKFFHVFSHFFIFSYFTNIFVSSCSSFRGNVRRCPRHYCCSTRQW